MIFVAMYVKLCGLGLILISLWVLPTLHIQRPLHLFSRTIRHRCSSAQGCVIR